jgi:hypothetical protein
VGIKDDFCREGNSRIVKIINQDVSSKIEEWGRAWSIIGSTVLCKGCGGTQDISESGGAFLEHQSSCYKFRNPNEEVPIGKLADILANWRLELWRDEDYYLE